MKLIDISWPITADMTAYKDRPTVSFEQTKTFDKDGARETKLTLGSHTGTHVDSPAHFLAKGDTVNKIPLEQLVGPCTVFDMMSVDSTISRDDLAAYDIDEGAIVLLKTKNSQHKPTDLFDPNFVYFDPSGAEYLVECGVAAVGIDYSGIERDQPDHETHKTLMLADIAIIEGLRLAHVPEGEYIFICLPLSLPGLDAAPARAILIDEVG